jgi:hypothetical protein
MAIFSPVWQAATTGGEGNAGHVNQFRGGSHSAAFIYQGALQISQTTGSGTYSSTQGQWLSQTFVTAPAQTAVGQVSLQISAVGGSPTLALIPPLTLGIYADDGFGNPIGSPLAATTMSGNYIYSSSFWVQIPLAATGLTPNTTYHLVTTAVGTAGHYYVWQNSTQTLGAATSADGITWTNATFGLMFRVYDQSIGGIGPIQFVVEDSGARWTQFIYNANGTINQLVQMCQAQTTSGALQQTRTLSYSNGMITGVI